MKRIIAIALFAIAFMSLSGTQPASGQPAQISSTISLTYLNIQVTYPSEILPGNSATINIQATAKSSIDLVNLSAQIYYADGTSLRQVSTATLASNTYLRNGDKISRDMQVAVPQDAPRTSLIALLNEKIQFRYYDYYYSPYYYYPYYFYYYNYSWPYYYPGYYYDFYPSYSYTTKTDDGITPLSYIKATTPEYVALESEYQMVQQKLAQTQAENQQLQHDLKNAQTKITEQNSMIADLTQQLSTARGTIGTLELVSIALVALVVILGVAGAYLWGKNRGSVQKASVKNE